MPIKHHIDSDHSKLQTRNVLYIFVYFDQVLHNMHGGELITLKEFERIVIKCDMIMIASSYNPFG
jgi:hypothetical protein